MKGKIGQLTDALAGNLWLLPLLSLVFAYAISSGLEAFDRTFDGPTHSWFLYGGSPQGARQLLSTIAGSMITFIGLVFSSTILVLQLASSQFSPRIMRSFFRDRVIQLSLGTFIATFGYAILVLREVREDPARPFVPGLSTYTAVLLVWLSLGMFVVYINHIAQRIRAINVIKIAAEETLECLQRLHDQRPVETVFAFTGDAYEILTATSAGSVAEVDAEELLRLTTKHDMRVEVIPMAGDFVCIGSPVIRIWSIGKIDATLTDSILGTVSIERERTMRGDVLFGLRQLVDIADKALSPGINDPTTAVQVLDQIHELLRNVAAALPRCDVHADAFGVGRVFIQRPTWKNYLDHALEEILLYGRGSMQVLRRLRTLLIDLESSAQPVHRSDLVSYRERVEAQIDETFVLSFDRAAARRLPAATLMKQSEN